MAKRRRRLTSNGEAYYRKTKRRLVIWRFIKVCWALVAVWLLYAGVESLRASAREPLPTYPLDLPLDYNEDNENR